MQRGEVMNAIKRARETGEAEVEVQEEMFAKEIEMRKKFLSQETEWEIANAKET